MSFCSGCGRKIFWGITEEDQRVPLDSIAPVYVAVDGSEMTNDSQGIRREIRAYVSHFSTCSKANHFSKKNPVRAKALTDENHL